MIDDNLIDELRRPVPACKAGHDVASDLLLIILLDLVSPAGGHDDGRRSSGHCHQD
jgi:hypothetical protein